MFLLANQQNSSTDSSLIFTQAIYEQYLSQV